jgi:hypothetical protein
MSSDEAMFATYSKDENWMTVKAPLGNNVLW